MVLIVTFRNAGDEPLRWMTATEGREADHDPDRAEQQWNQTDVPFNNILTLGDKRFGGWRFDDNECVLMNDELLVSIRLRTLVVEAPTRWGFDRDKRWDTRDITPQQVLNNSHCHSYPRSDRESLSLLRRQQRGRSQRHHRWNIRGGRQHGQRHVAPRSCHPSPQRSRTSSCWWRREWRRRCWWWRRQLSSDFFFFFHLIDVLRLLFCWCLVADERKEGRVPFSGHPISFRTLAFGREIWRTSSSLTD